MTFIKTLLVGLVGATLCIADISGIVTDTGGVPISGAIVWLENGGQKDTTESNGTFTLSGIQVGIKKQIYTSFQNKVSAIIKNGLLYLNSTEKSVVQIVSYNLQGKAISTIQKAVDIGMHSIVLPPKGAGIYLYKIKVRQNEFVLMSNLTGGSGCASSVFSSNNVLTKQAKATAAISAVIAATKEGLLNYRCVIGNSDTSEIVIKMIANAGDLTDLDGNVYHTVRIGNQVWMAENLRTTKYNDSTEIPEDTTQASWGDATTPYFCFYKNTSNADSKRKFGALYNWYVVGTNKLAPKGWHVPSQKEWYTLQNYLISNGYNWDETTSGNKIAKSLAERADWDNYPFQGTIGYDLAANNKSGFSALPAGGCQGYISYAFDEQGYGGSWWTSTSSSIQNTYAESCGLGSLSESLIITAEPKDVGMSVRLLKDE
jgi:uncharacterized protein (TIGR02145 family)